MLGRVGETHLRSYTTRTLPPGRILGCGSVRWLVRVARRCAFLPLLVAALFQLRAVRLSASELVSRSATALVASGFFLSFCLQASIQGPCCSCDFEFVELSMWMLTLELVSDGTGLFSHLN